ncbi:MAG: putative lipid II flippase FtsW [Candidatus Caldatribacterium sp.]|uniref:putative lipid II flippase FtsW n=1 Tax=Candidatus Caldatribacterium sp. TaxID=2282143 RepID=UPI002992865C|nr:putative lipid II flippase FtsW [Candidatus Caldatribacterium sp.]MCX7730114.1 putative lipid II flippase FtsW [Candidatus Caldatribacterium sp.]MDW8080450.1 putative lipid II flippase FtsW [Candidatus Calescibacterium sp.]
MFAFWGRVRLRTLREAYEARFRKVTWWWEIDPFLFWAVLTLTLFGTIMVFSASMTTALYAYGDVFFFLKRHLFALCVGTLGCVVSTFLSLERLRKMSKTLLCLVFFLLLLVFIPGIGRAGGGAHRWIDVGPFNFQPSELAKFVIILYMADALATYRDRVQDFWRGVVPFLIVVGSICLLVLLEPDFGTAIMLLLLALVMIFLGGGNITHIFLVVVLLAPVGLFLLFFGKRYWLDRIIAFLNPWNDPRGKGFHILQSLIALGSGGIWGRGLGESRQKFFFLPDRHTDFIYAIVGEELGFVGTVFVVILFGIILWRGLRIALQSGEEFEGLLAMGIVGSILMQALVNMGAVLRLLPVTGITLPFVSYGSSSLFVTLVKVGVLFNIARKRGRRGR